MDNVRKVDPVNPDTDIINEAANIIVKGGTVAFPTETVYGLGANALDDEACRKIFKIKGREQDNPIIVHISDFDQLDYVSQGLSGRIREAFEIVWPGPLTVVLAKKNIGSVPTAGLDSVAIRMPAHRIPQELIKRSGFPIAAPSANKSGRPSPVFASEVAEDLDNKVDMILDGGPASFGVESTVILFRNDEVVILRPGAFSAEDIKRLFNLKVSISGEVPDAPISPGMKYRHYAPEKELVLGLDEDKIIKECEAGDVLFIGSSEMAKRVNSESIMLGSRKDLYEVARNLFPSFRELDRSKYPKGIIEGFEEKGIGLAIMNRIRKATGGKVI
ncbi:MAG: L-threonylcarbamoyladenylate synthase [Thermoplasmata archaeon]